MDLYVGLGGEFGEGKGRKHTCLEASEVEWTSFPKFPFNCNSAGKIKV